MQRIKSIRRSISTRSARRRSGLSTTSSTGSPRPSHDASTVSPPDSTTDLTASPSPSPAGKALKIDNPKTRDAVPAAKEDTTHLTPDAAAADNTDGPADAVVAPAEESTPQSLTASTFSDPPVVVEPPSPSTPPPAPDHPTATTATTATAVTGREAADDSALRHRRTSIPTEIATTAQQDTQPEPAADKMPELVQRSWVALAVASGGFAALNGVFAKLTTDALTTRLSRTLSTRLQLDPSMVNPTVRGAFFALNLLSNAVMWALFTRALTAHPSATKVSLINTSANFLVTAVLGALIFAEVLPAQWFGGAALLVLGTLIIGRDRAGTSAASAASRANGNAAAGTGAGAGSSKHVAEL